MCQHYTSNYKMRKHCLGIFVPQHFPRLSLLNKYLHFQVSHDQKTRGLNLYVCTCKECGLQKKKKKQFSYYRLPICCSLEIYEMHRKSQAFAENEKQC